MEMLTDTNSIVYFISELLVAIFSILGNALVIISFLRDRSLRTPTNLFVFSLAVTDLATSGIAIPLYLRSMLTHLPQDFRACVCVQSLILTFCTISIFHLIAVSFDRYMAIVWRRRPVSHEMGMRRASSFIACAWIAGILIGCLPLMGWNQGDHSNGFIKDCNFLDVISMKYLMFLFYVTIVIPTLIMTFFYVSIYHSVRRQNERMLSIRHSIDSRVSVSYENGRKMTQDDNGNAEISRKFTTDSTSALIQDSINMEEKHRKWSWLQGNRSASLPATGNRKGSTFQKRQTAKTKRIIFSLLIVIICFFISWYPLYTMNAVLYYCVSCQIPSWAFYGPIVLSHVSSAVNPFIYARTMPGFKEAFIETLSCGRIQPTGANSKRRRSTLLTDFNIRKPSSSSALLSQRKSTDSEENAYK